MADFVKPPDLAKNLPNCGPEFHRHRLIHILQMAYSGELAAALAYAGHWRAAWKQSERQDIHRIEMDEWHHRAGLLKMLHELGAKPVLWRDLMMRSLGSVIFLACFVSGWYMPMYFAGRLEQANIQEYEDAAYHASSLGLEQYAAIIKVYAQKEVEHEQYFFNLIAKHWLTPLMRSIFHYGPDRL